jgi:hypothetical protein
VTDGRVGFSVSLDGLPRIVAAVLAAAMGLAACSLPWQQPTRSSEQLLHDARGSYFSATTYHMTATFTKGGTHYRLDLQVHRPDATGTDQVGDLKVELIVAGGKTYRRGREFFRQAVSEKMAKLVGDSWVLDADLDLVSLVSPNLFDDLNSSRAKLTQAGGPVLHGYRTEKLSHGRTSMYISSHGKAYPIRVEDQQGDLVPGTTDLQIDFYEYGGDVTVVAPSSYVDLQDPATLPAFFQALGVTQVPDQCDRSGCTLKATLRNDGRAGTTTAEFSADFNGAQIGSCTAEVPETAYQASVETSCRIATAEWTTWWDTHALASFIYQVVVHNPAYE